jgi:hypothetical protein
MVALLGLVATMALASAASAQMVGQWHMDDGAGTTSTPDTSGSNLPLSSSAALQIAPDGRFANQLSMANTSILKAPVSAILQPAQVTLIAWAKMSGPAPALRYVAGAGDDGPGTCLGSSYAMYTGFGANTGLYFYIRGPETTPGAGPTSYLSANPGNAIWDGNWHMLAGTYDGAAVHLYVDGVEVGSPTPTLGAPIKYDLAPTGGQQFYVDGYPQQPPNCLDNSDFPGGIDEVRVYNRALTQNELARLAAWPGPDAPPALIVDPPPPPPPAPIPVAKKSVVGTEISGRVLVRLPGTKKFVDLTTVTSLPLGTVVNATAGRISITAAANNKGATQTAVFYDGIFKLGQTGPSSKLTTVLALFGNEPVCPKKKAKGKRSSGAAKKSKSRRLWGDGKGRFQTKGQYSSATVRGTKWLVQDSCKGTLTKVARGSVTVRDFVKRKNVIVKAGNSYLAKRSR